MFRPARNATIASSAAVTMNRALRMLLAAMMRLNRSGAARLWISAYSGTM